MTSLLRRYLLVKHSVPQKHINFKALNHFLHKYKHSDAKQSQKPISLVILDKDGTLVEFGTGWSEWVTQLSNCIKKKTGSMAMEEKLFNLFGFDVQSQKWHEGLLCDSPGNIHLSLVKFLELEGMKTDISSKVIEHCLSVVDDSLFTKEGVVPIDNPRAICRTLKYYNIKTAICTMDSRVSTNLMLGQLGLENSFDFILCGDDQAAQPKPNPSNVFHICNALNVDLNKTAFIGDAKRDVEMGRKANVGLNVGVLSGVCNREELAPEADVVVSSIKIALGHFLPNGYEEIYEEWNK